MIVLLEVMVRPETVRQDHLDGRGTSLDDIVDIELI